MKKFFSVLFFVATLSGFLHGSQQALLQELENKILINAFIKDPVGANIQGFQVETVTNTNGTEQFLSFIKTEDTSGKRYWGLGLPELVSTKSEVVQIQINAAQTLITTLKGQLSNFNSEEPAAKRRKRGDAASDAQEATADDIQASRDKLTKQIQMLEKRAALCNSFLPLLLNEEQEAALASVEALLGGQLDADLAIESPENQAPQVAMAVPAGTQAADASATLYTDQLYKERLQEVREQKPGPTDLPGNIKVIASKTCRKGPAFNVYRCLSCSPSRYFIGESRITDHACNGSHPQDIEVLATQVAVDELGMCECPHGCGTTMQYQNSVSHISTCRREPLLTQLLLEVT